MSDDLVKRARDCANGIGSFKSDKGDLGLLDDLADRIEALEAALIEADALDRVMEHQIKRTPFTPAPNGISVTLSLQQISDQRDTLSAYRQARDATR